MSGQGWDCEGIMEEGRLEGQEQTVLCKGKWQHCWGQSSTQHKDRSEVGVTPWPYGPTVRLPLSLGP